MADSSRDPFIAHVSSVVVEMSVALVAMPVERVRALRDRRLSVCWSERMGTCHESTIDGPPASNETAAPLGAVLCICAAVASL